MGVPYQRNSEMKKCKFILQSGTATALAVSLAVMPVSAGDENPFHLKEINPSSHREVKLAQGMCGACGGNWEGSCGGMMGRPTAIGPAELPDPKSEGSKLVSEFCVQCHDLPSPKQHSVSGWPPTVDRMYNRMNLMSSSNNPMQIKVPTRAELSKLTAYLQAHAIDPEDASGSKKGQGSNLSPPGKSPIEILQERYARGEIDRKEYLQRLEDLKK